MNNYAGFWIRVLAYFLDSLVLILPVFIVDYLLFYFIGPDKSFYFQYNFVDDSMIWTTYDTVSSIAGLFIGILYFGWMTSKYKATLGKSMLGLQVVNEQGEAISFGRAIGRYLSYNLSAILYIGYLMVAFDEKKQGLHDKICKTYVVYK